MNEDKKYLFDLNGYLVVEQVLTKDELAIANEGIDRHLHEGRYRPEEQSRAKDAPALKGEHGRGELRGMFEWEEPYCNVFRDMLAHPRIVPYLNEILGKGFRVDHRMFLLWMDKGAEGHRFHGSSGPGFDPNQYYIVKNGQMHNGLTVVAFQLTDINPGDGGLIVIPGSHKSNYACPPEMRRYEKYQEHIRQLTCKAGDVIIFTEAVTHGTLQWTADHPRRSTLTRYTAGNMAYMPSFEIPEWADERVRAVMEQPYHSRLDRPMLDE